MLEGGILSEDVTGAGFGLDPGSVAVRPNKRLVPATRPKPDLKAALRDAEKQAATALADA
ncbi:MAG: hypothetical protein H0T61_06075 [Actinobacteria bacterium]|nr:hypothetical protein [Actinomycetota bacterium]